MNSVPCLLYRTTSQLLSRAEAASISKFLQDAWTLDHCLTNCFVTHCMNKSDVVQGSVLIQVCIFFFFFTFAKARSVCVLCIQNIYIQMAEHFSANTGWRDFHSRSVMIVRHHLVGLTWKHSSTSTNVAVINSIWVTGLNMLTGLKAQLALLVWDFFFLLLF